MPVVLDSNTPEDEKDRWRTHPALFRLLNEEFHFHIDVAASAENALCERYFTKEDDALQQQWADYENGIWRVFCNPPFSMAAEFLAKGNQETKENGALCVFIVKADSPETGWFVDNVVHPPDSNYMGRPRNHVRYLVPRVPFLQADGSKPRHGPHFPSAVIIMFPPRYQPPMAEATVRWWWWKKEAIDRGLWDG